jgi:hypothetical protein
METQDEKISPERSLAIIEGMIQQAKGRVSNISFYFLLWGWVITLCNFAMYYVVKYTDYGQYAPAVWTLCIPAWVVTMIYGARQGRSTGIVTHLDRISMWLWICMAITICPLWVFGEKINWMVNALILMPVGAATFMSGIIIQFRPLLLGGIVFWVAGVTCYFLQPIDQYLVGGIAMILGYLLPGYLLKYQKEAHA